MSGTRGWARLSRAARAAVVLALAGWLPAPPAAAAVVRVEIASRESVLAGRRFGAYGSYELLRGRLVFGFDPANPANRRIVDLGLAPRGASGLVEAIGDLVVLQPADASRRRGLALVEVSNRGGKFSPRYFDRAAEASLDPSSQAAWGDALLLRQGLTVIWVGWQFDVPDEPGLLRLEVPRARRTDGGALSGLVRSDWVVDERVTTLPLAHRNHRAYPVADPAFTLNRLTVRDSRDGPRRLVPRSEWSFARATEAGVVPDPTSIYRPAGFEAGRIYELVYRAEDPAIVGLGLAAIRDVIAFAKHDRGCPFPVRRGLAAGVSQTGRFLRHFLYQGFNTDEAGRRAYDGLLVITAGAGRGSFNHRFAQPSRDAHRYSAFFYPTDLFPFSSRTQLDPRLWRSDGLLAHLDDPAQAPRTFYVNTGYEYWGRAAALVHTSVDGTADVEPLPNERIYHLAGGQHYVRDFRPEALAAVVPGRVYRDNPLDYSGAFRALLVRLAEWVESDVPPPASAYPRLERGELAAPERLAFPALQGVPVARRAHVAYRVDYGPRWPEGVIELEPPLVGEPYPALVPQVDALGNEYTGIRSVELRVPIATYTPWSLRSGAAGGADELADFVGTVIPLPRDATEKRAWVDPRPSLDALYPGGRDGYLARVGGAIEELVGSGFLLEDDRERVLRRAAAYWDWITTRPRGEPTRP